MKIINNIEDHLTEELEELINKIYNEIKITLKTFKSWGDKNEMAILKAELKYMQWEKNDLDKIKHLGINDRQKLQKLEQQSWLRHHRYFHSKNAVLEDYHLQKQRLITEKLKSCELFELYPSKELLNKRLSSIKPIKNKLVKLMYYTSAGDLRDEEKRINRAIEILSDS